MNNFHGILCDLDGTLVDSEEAHLAAWEEMARRHAFVLAPGWEKDYLGKPDLLQAEKIVAANPRLGDPVRLVEERHTLFRDMVAEWGRRLVFPGAEKELQRLRRIGVKMAVASNSPSQNCAALLRAAALVRFFPVLVSIEMVQNPKPAPDVFLEAARRLELPPSACIALEDTPLGVAAGRAAGCQTIGITRGRGADSVAGADMTFETFAEALAWLADSLEKPRLQG